MKNATKIISKVELKVGMIAHFYGARFEITSAELKQDYSDKGEIMVANGKWINGTIITGYFGPTKDWNFQGNKSAMVTVEI